MILTVKNEAPFQILSGAFTIGPSPTGYELQVGATPQSFTTLFSVGANTPRMVTNVANGSYYRLKNNVGDVKVNWSRTCIDNQGGGNAGQLEPVNEFPLSPVEGTVVALASGDTVGVFQFDGTDWVAVGGGDLSDYYTKQETNQAISAATQDLASTDYVDDAIAAIPDPDLSNYYTKQETDAAITSATQDFVTEAYVDAAITSATQDFVTEADITAATSTIQEQLDDVERVTATALTELHQDILDLSGATPDLSNYYTSAQTEDAISAATSGKADAANVTPKTGRNFPNWNAQGIITGSSEMAWLASDVVNGRVRKQILSNDSSSAFGIYAPESVGTAGDILVSTGNGAPVWANDDKVSSTSVTTIWRGTQAEYDAITTPDASTLYIIIGS